jgi:hypothetical protein
LGGFVRDLFDYFKTRLKKRERERIESFFLFLKKEEETIKFSGCGFLKTRVKEKQITHEVWADMIFALTTCYEI